MTGNYIPISSVGGDDKPREKMLLKGVTALSTNELLAILIRSGSGGESALDLSRRILTDASNDLNTLARLSVSDFMNRYKGVGMAKAASIIAAMELGRRRALSTAREEPALTTSRDLYDYLQPLIGDLDHEEFWVVTLSSACRIKSCDRLFSGGVASTIIDIRMIFRKVLESKACSIVIAHNHPSGNDRPSSHDIALTKETYREAAGVYYDITLLDHIVVCPNRYYSFADNGMLLIPLSTEKLNRKNIFYYLCGSYLCHIGTCNACQCGILTVGGDLALRKSSLKCLFIKKIIYDMAEEKRSTQENEFEESQTNDTGKGRSGIQKNIREQFTKRKKSKSVAEKRISNWKSRGQKLIEMNDKYLRLSAELDDYRKRTLKRKNGVNQECRGTIVK